LASLAAHPALLMQRLKIVNRQGLEERACSRRAGCRTKEEQSAAHAQRNQSGALPNGRAKATGHAAPNRCPPQIAAPSSSRRVAELGSSSGQRRAGQHTLWRVRSKHKRDLPCSSAPASEALRGLAGRWASRPMAGASDPRRCLLSLAPFCWSSPRFRAPMNSRLSRRPPTCARIAGKGSS